MTFTGQKGNLVSVMFKKMIMTVLAAGLLFGPPPTQATNILDSVFAQVEETGNGLEVASLDKEKPSKEEKRPPEEKESKTKKKYDDFRDKNGNGIDDRFERKDPPKKKKKGKPEEVNF